MNMNTPCVDINIFSEEAARFLGYCSLKQEQKTVIEQFLFGKDVFAVLPCYVCLPYVIDAVLGTDHSIVVVVSPLVSIVKDQVRKLIDCNEK